jgi:4-hydroxy-2-oxoheptanedioate aldolase
MPHADRRNPIRSQWSAGRASVGTWCSIPALGAVEAVAQAGFDWVIVDWQHGQFDGEALGLMIQTAALAGAAPLVRVPDNEPWMIQRALDLGACGVVVPLVNTAAQAEAAAAASRYPPVGRRSFGPIRASRAIGWEPARANDEIVCIVQIETREALDNVEAIAGTPGVDALFVGPADLALSLELELGAPELDALLAPVLTAGAARGLPVGRHCDTPSGARAAFDAGFLYVAVGGDTEFLGAAAAEAARSARAEPAPRGRYADNVVRLLVSSAPPAP